MSWHHPVAKQDRPLHQPVTFTADDVLETEAQPPDQPAELLVSAGAVVSELTWVGALSLAGALLVA